MIHLVLLSGGSGTRLWPLSNEARSKQFLKVLRDENGKPVSMVQRVISQIKNVGVDLDITIATSESQKNSIESQIPGAYSLALEPERRDTAPAIMLACANLALKQGASPEETVIVMPIDAYTTQEFYDHIIKLDQAVQHGVFSLILLGVEPTYPSEKYGYIIPAERTVGLWPVKEFKEKPDATAARLLIEQGGLWNCGVFAFKLRYIQEIIDSYHKPDDYDDLLRNFASLPKNSFDYEVVEKADNIAVIPYSGQWKDLGTWNTLTDEMYERYSGRVTVDESTCEDLHVINETGLPLVVAGMRNAVVVATPDGILVSGKSESTNIKEYVSQAAENRPMYEKRLWGEYRVMGSNVYPNGQTSITKELVIEPGRQISHQLHKQRDEIWTVVSGIGEVALDGEVIPVGPRTVIRIEAGQLHAVRAIEKLYIIEVQLGTFLSEEDIERFGNYWS